MEMALHFWMISGTHPCSIQFLGGFWYYWPWYLSGSTQRIGSGPYGIVLVCLLSPGSSPVSGPCLGEIQSLVPTMWSAEMITVLSTSTWSYWVKTSIPWDKVWSISWWFPVMHLCPWQIKQCCGFLILVPGGCEVLNGKQQASVLVRWRCFGPVDPLVLDGVALPQTAPCTSGCPSTHMTSTWREDSRWS